MASDGSADRDAAVRRAIDALRSLSTGDQVLAVQAGVNGAISTRRMVRGVRVMWRPPVPEIPTVPSSSPTPRRRSRDAGQCLSHADLDAQADALGLPGGKA